MPPEKKKYNIMAKRTYTKFKFRKRRKGESRKTYKKIYMRARDKAYYKEHKEEIKARKKAYNAAHPELFTVKSHYRWIVNWEVERLKGYKGMRFYDGWNPKKGGSLQAGADWIVENLGKRPKGCSMHIVDHAKGFVPGNLIWANRKIQSAQQMFKIIANQQHYINKLEAKIAELEAQKAELKAESEAKITKLEAK